MPPKQKNPKSAGKKQKPKTPTKESKAKAQPQGAKPKKAAEASGILSDPWKPVANDRTFEEQDVFSLIFEKPRAQALDDYVHERSVRQTVFRLFWFMPLDSVYEGRTIKDSRGEFIKWDGFWFEIENLMEASKIEVKATVPGTLNVGTEYEGKTNVRTELYDFSVNAKSKKSRHYNFKDHKNQVSPCVNMLLDTDGTRRPAIALMDFVVVRADATSVAQLLTNSQIFQLTVKSKYDVERAKVQTGTLLDRKKFVIADIGEVAAIYHIDPIVTPQQVEMPDGSTMPKLENSSVYNMCGARGKCQGGPALMRYRDARVRDYTERLTAKGCSVGGFFDDLVKWVEATVDLVVELF